MRIAGNDSPFLTYCTNIHVGNGWSEVFANLRAHAPELKRRLSPDDPFAIGLRISACECEELLAEGRIEELRGFLDDEGLYIPLINGFPYGAFHDRGLKADVFAPDWRTPARLEYTLNLVEVLRRLLPEGIDGGISTSPLSYKKWIVPGSSDVWHVMTNRIVKVAEALVRARWEDGAMIHLDIEPEPDGLVENCAETIDFYSDWLLPVGTPILADALGVTTAEAQELLLDHITLCYDTCHFAVEYENPADVIEKLSKEGIRIGRVQVSSALRVTIPEGIRDRERMALELTPFAESTYLHQVIEMNGARAATHYSDLPEALAAIGATDGEEWRIHFHIPLFLDRYGAFDSTQESVRGILRMLHAHRFTSHLEIETYTWDVLPADLKLGLIDSIEREYRWLIDTWSALEREQITRGETTP